MKKLSEFYYNAFYYIEKQDQYDILTNIAAEELLKKKIFQHFYKNF